MSVSHGREPEKLRSDVKALRHHHLTLPVDGVWRKPEMCEGGVEEVVVVETLQITIQLQKVILMSSLLSDRFTNYDIETYNTIQG